MDVNFIRKLNLLRLIEQEGGLRKFAGKIGSDESYISTILSDASKRNAGDELMRRVEKVYKLGKNETADRCCVCVADRVCRSRAVDEPREKRSPSAARPA
jgi:hypothetical protein